MSIVFILTLSVTTFLFRFHSESRILTTIFALLFWDIIFADVPGAFETPHQTAPLDLAEDSFYRARKTAIETRLEEIQHMGRALEIVAEHDVNYRERKTWCVGVRWDICERQDLLEIVEVSHFFSFKRGDGRV